MVRQFLHGYALVIGVDENNVSDWALPDVAKDVAALHGVLCHPERCAYPPEHVRVVKGEAVTKQGILDGLQWLANQIAADPSGAATAIVYYTGHGWQDTQVTPPAYYFIPYDVQRERLRGTSLRAEDVAEAIAALRPRRLLVILDCCHAGGMGVKDINLPMVRYALAVPLPTVFTEDWGEAKALSEKGLEQLQTGQGRAVLVSSQGPQKSYLRSDRAMSIFTYHLIEALTGHAQPEGGASEVLVSDVLSHVYRTVPASAQALGETQQPDGRLAGNFPVALLLGGQGLAKGVAAPDPLVPPGQPPAGSAPALTFDNAGMQATQVNQGQTVYDRSAHAEGGGSATVYSVSGGGAIATGGGVAVGGNVHGGISVGGTHTGGGDTIGGDKLQGDKVTFQGPVDAQSLAVGHGAHAEASQGIDPAQLNQLLVPLFQAVARSQAAAAQQAEAYQTITELKQELVNGKQADDSRIAKLIDGLVDLIPAAVGAVTAAFASPILAGVAGPVTGYVLSKLRGKP